MNDEDKRAAISRELPHVIRVMSKGLDPKKKIDMNGPAEKAVAEKHIGIGKTRALLGGTFGSVIGLGVWKSMRTNNKFFAAFLGASGAFVGATYGILSIREEFFVDILSLPDDQSEFAKTARSIIERDMPQSIILKEAYHRMGNLTGNSDLMQSAWEDTKKKERFVDQSIEWDQSQVKQVEIVSPSPPPPAIELVKPQSTKNVFGFNAPTSPSLKSTTESDTRQIKSTTWEEIRKSNRSTTN